MSSFTYYIYVLIAIVVGIIIFKKITSCLFKTILTAILVIALVVIYYLYFRS